MPTRPDLIVRLVQSDSSDFTTLVSAFFTELEERYPGLGEDEPASEQDLLIAAVAYSGDTPVACGALRELEPSAAEVKRMYVAPEARRIGAARRILAALEERADSLGYSAVRLGTGVRQPEAIALYESCGYRHIPCFGEYEGTELCVCFEKALRSTT